NLTGFSLGPPATINVGGMVTFTTADYMRLTDNTRFNAVAGPGDVLLTAAPVAAFGFLGNNPAAIAIQGSTLQVAQGQSLSLVGGYQGFIATDPDTGNPIPVPGGITMTGGKLIAPNGPINITTVAGPGEVLASNVQSTSKVTGGPITFSQGANLDVSGGTSGTISIRGGQFVVENASLVANATGTVAGPAGAIAVDVNAVALTNGARISTSTSGPTPGSAVTITARDSVSLAEGSTISTTTIGSGPGGAVTMTAGQTVSLAGTQSGIVTTTAQQAPGGTITVQAADVRLSNGAVIIADTQGPGRAGNISVEVGTATLDAGSRITSSTE